MAFIIALISALASFVISSSFEYSVWQKFASVSLLDLCVMYLASTAIYNIKKRKWITSLFFISIASNLFTMITVFLYGTIDGELIAVIADKVTSYNYNFSVAITALVFAVSLMPKGILNVFDRVCWPSYFDDFYNSSIKVIVNDTKKGIF